MSVTAGGLSRYMWQGLSGDTKPTDNRVGVNDVFYETDTGVFWIWNYGTTSWKKSVVGRPPQELLQ